MAHLMACEKAGQRGKLMAIDEVECRIRIQKQGELKRGVLTIRRKRKVNSLPDQMAHQMAHQTA